MYAVVKHHCVSNGPARVVEIITTDKASWCIIQITAEKFPEGDLETRGLRSTLVCAHDLPFDRKSVDWKIKPVESFTALYMTNGRELFSIKYDGKKAVLEILNFDKARKLYQELPQKLLPENYIFDPATFQRNARIDRKNAGDQKDTEAQEREKHEEYKKSSALYVQSGSSLGVG